MAVQHVDTGVTTSAEADGSPVSEADRAVERLLREQLSRARPADAFLGEEHGRVGDSDRVRILEPIDGTTFFGRRDPHWRVDVALGADGVTELAGRHLARSDRGGGVCSPSHVMTAIRAPS